jgi:hypothetical protein
MTDTKTMEVAELIHIVLSGCEQHYFIDTSDGEIYIVLDKPLSSKYARLKQADYSYVDGHLQVTRPGIVSILDPEILNPEVCETPIEDWIDINQRYDPVIGALVADPYQMELEYILDNLHLPRF